MKYVRKVISTVVTFLLGLEVGGFGMWYLTMKAINESQTERTTRTSYRSYGSYKE